MPAENQSAIAVKRTAEVADETSRELMLRHGSNEFVFAVVGHVGSGTSEIAEQLTAILKETSLRGSPVQVKVLKAKDVIKRWASSAGESVPDDKDKSLAAVKRYQDLGDQFRGSSGDYSAVARGLVDDIRVTRAEFQGVKFEPSKPVDPDGKPHAYILDSIRHPAEVNLLRHIYQDAFILIGVVCEEKVREIRITTKYSDAGVDNAREFMKRDAKSGGKHGQRTSDAFHIADFFVDNTAERIVTDDTGRNKRDNELWNVSDKLQRLVDIICHEKVVRPEISETAMHHAHGAGMRSACLSRQVGAAVVDRQGNVLATGTNEVPRAGGGVYGESFEMPRTSGEVTTQRVAEHRCAFVNKFCSNTREQNDIINDVINEIPQTKDLRSEPRDDLLTVLREGRIGDILEFSRAVHAEMDAILSASRAGASVVGAHLFVTTFPCHYCARHIITAGIDEVQYIEPYPKSAAFRLHSDAIQVTAANWKPPSDGGSKVLFRPFSGVAPRLYRRAFLKDRDLKNDRSGDMSIGEPEWGTAWHLRKLSYVEMEAQLTPAK